MAAIAALVCFLLAFLLGLLGTSAPFDLVLLGWVFVALHLVIGRWPLGGRLAR